MNDSKLGVRPYVLLVNNKDANLHLLIAIFETFDVNLILAQSRQEALSKIQNQEIALALFDSSMSTMDGVAFAEAIQNDKSKETVPIIFIIANTEEELELEKYCELGTFDFILKPLRHNTVLNKLMIFLGIYKQKKLIHEIHLNVGQTTRELAISNKSLQESEALLNSIIENIPLNIYIKESKNLNFVRCNKAVEKLLGYPREVLIGKNDYDFFPIGDANFFISNDRKVLRNKVLKDIQEEKIQSKHHGERILHNLKIPITNDEGQAEYLLVILEDITTRKQTENALKESEKMYRTLLNTSPDGIIIMDLKGCITEISNIILEIFGAGSKSEFIGVPFFRFIPSSEVKKMKEILSNAQSEGLIQNIEFILTRKNQSQFICELSITLIQEADGKPDAYMVVIRDISQRKKLEQQLNRSERMVSLGEMASGMAHEINQPLLSITLGIENLFQKIQWSKGVDKSYFHNKSEKIFEDILRIGRIIDHVRAFSRDHDEYIFTSFDINDSIKNAISMVSEQFKHHGIRVTIQLDKKVHPTIGNTYRFEQVILNLLTNAKDSLEKTMKISKLDFEKTIVIKTYHDADTNYVEVKDNGNGIKPDVIDRIMLPFYTTKEAGKGTGLGLSISFGIIKELKGSIDVESDPVSGTTFRISLPTPEIKAKTNYKNFIAPKHE